MASKTTLQECALYVFICIVISFVLVSSTVQPSTFEETVAFWKNNSCTFPPVTTFYADILSDPDDLVLKPCFSDFSRIQGEADAFTGNLCNALYLVSRALCSKNVKQSYLTPDKVNPYIEDEQWDVCNYAKITRKKQLLFMTRDRVACERFCMNSAALGPVCRLLVAGVVNYIDSLGEWKASDRGQSQTHRDTEPPEHGVLPGSAGTVGAVPQKPEGTSKSVDPNTVLGNPAYNNEGGVEDHTDLNEDKGAIGTGAKMDGLPGAASTGNRSTVSEWKASDRGQSQTHRDTEPPEHGVLPGSAGTVGAVPQKPKGTSKSVDPNTVLGNPAYNNEGGVEDHTDLNEDKGAIGTGVKMDGLPGATSTVNRSTMSEWKASDRGQSQTHRDTEPPEHGVLPGSARTVGAVPQKPEGTSKSVDPNTVSGNPAYNNEEGVEDHTDLNEDKGATGTGAKMDGLPGAASTVNRSTSNVKVDSSVEVEGTANKNIGTGRKTSSGLDGALGQPEKGSQGEGVRDALSASVDDREDVTSSSLHPFGANDEYFDNEEDDDEFEAAITDEGDNNHDSEISSGPKIGKQPDFPSDGIVKIPRQMEGYEEESSGHFMAYFVTAVVLCIAGYVVYHNKQKILAFILEGRRDAQRRRTTSSGTAKYSKLQPSVEEVMPTLDNSATTKNFIY